MPYVLGIVMITMRYGELQISEFHFDAYNYLHYFKNFDYSSVYFKFSMFFWNTSFLVV